MHTYTVASATDRLLVFTTNASSDAEAVRQAHALAVVFMRFRAVVLKTQQRLGIRALASEIAIKREALVFLEGRVLARVSSDAKKDLQKKLTSERRRSARSSTPRSTTLSSRYPWSKARRSSIRRADSAVAQAPGRHLRCGRALREPRCGPRRRHRRRGHVEPSAATRRRRAHAWNAGQAERRQDPQRGGRLARSPVSPVAHSHQRRIVAHLRGTVADGGTALAVVPIDNASAVALVHRIAGRVVRAGRQARRLGRSLGRRTCGTTARCGRAGHS